VRETCQLKTALADVFRELDQQFAACFIDNDCDLERALGFSVLTSQPWTRRRWSVSRIAFVADYPNVESAISATFMDYAIGAVFGRWDIRRAVAKADDGVSRDPLKALPPYPPARLLDDNGLPSCSDHVDYLFSVQWNGILSDDPGSGADLIEKLRNLNQSIWGARGDDILQRGIQILECYSPCPDGLRGWFRRNFFDDHLKRYSRSRRKAPIYWQLATQGAGYSIWLYYHRLNRDTFYKVLNDYLKPKVQHEQSKLDGLRQQAGDVLGRSQREENEAQEKLVEELRTFQKEIELVAPLWNPNLNDGVLINFAPLWRLVPQHRAWQQECKGCWDSLVAGDYDWSHLAMHLWPERVVPKCRTDASLAIAHGVEHVFWARLVPASPEDEHAELVGESDDEDEGEEEEEAPKKHPRKGRASPRWVPKEGVNEEQVKQLIQERTSSAVKDALEKLLAAPTPATGRVKGGGRGAARSRPSPAVLVPATGTEIDLVEQVRKAMQVNGDGVPKNSLAKATGLTADQVEAALHKLIEAGDVEKSGAGRGTRYRLLEGKR
jgi:hypothetical protein